MSSWGASRHEGTARQRRWPGQSCSERLCSFRFRTGLFREDECFLPPWPQRRRAGGRRRRGGPAGVTGCSPGGSDPSATQSQRLHQDGPATRVRGRGPLTALQGWGEEWETWAWSGVAPTSRLYPPSDQSAALLLAEQRWCQSSPSGRTSSSIKSPIRKAPSSAGCRNGFRGSWGWPCLSSMLEAFSNTTSACCPSGDPSTQLVSVSVAAPRGC